MATATPIITATVDLALTAEEAWWLLGFLQNSHTVDEPEPDAEEAMRHDLFQTLKAGLANVPKPRPR